MEYKVVSFTPTLNQQKETAHAVAEQLEKLITKYNDLGWEYVRVESVSTFVQPDSGCFGIGGKPGYMSAYQMVVFRR